MSTKEQNLKKIQKHINERWEKSDLEAALIEVMEELATPEWIEQFITDQHI